MKWKYLEGVKGIRFREHPTRKHGIHPDRYFTICYQHQGKRVEEGFGWLSEGRTLKKAIKRLDDLREAAKDPEIKNPDGTPKPTRLSEAREAEKERREQEALEKAREEKETLTFGQFFRDTYYPTAKRDKKPMSHKTEWGHFKNWIEPAIGAIPLKDLRPLHLERLKKTLLEAEKIKKDAPTETVKNPKSARTIQYIFATIRSTWNMARKHRVIEGDSPTKAVKKPKVENKRVRFLTTEEAQTLLEELERRDLATYRMAFISLFTGLRAGEVFNLKWKNLDQGKGLLWVMDSKSGKSRAVYMPEPVKAVFDGMTTGKPEDLIFPGPGGGIFPQIPRIFDRAVKRLGFNEGIEDRRERFTFHSLRHTAASFLIQSGVDLYTVKSILGHGSIALTERYSHLADTALKEAANKMPDLTRDQAAQKKVVILRKGGPSK
jgi:integrase